MSRKLTRSQVWGTPVVLGILSAAGLLAALFSDGSGDLAAWVTLAVPVAVSGWYSFREN
ncbi:hypothetical protein [Microbulbifer rhizosphaerae]|uniref:Uncharacterized protein n=1 Tax=Microbulbifer rhizosphaerae TaxID=1562603 RepID=A0A7W4ZAN8_9GAMM|nr:hypothetical protein [Microbulbifer rhizosphaerae]MBB3062967.1 hypothetical protein [Microbulbifer rhizosphaerae]